MQLDELIVEGSMPALDAMRRLSETGRRILFIAPGGVLQAVLTDSDIRRYILRGGDLGRPVGEVANPRPKSLPVERRSEARGFLLQSSIEALPLLSKDGRIVDVVFLNELDGAVRPAGTLTAPVVVMAGGRGTRLYPYTQILPKPLIPVGERPIIELVIDRFRAFGCRQFHVVVNYRKSMIKSYFSDLELDYGIHWVEEGEPLGTGGGLCLLKGRLDGTFFLTNCDILIDADYADLYAFHKRQDNAITMVCAAKQFTIPYGVVSTAGDGTLAGISEKPSMNYLTNTGMYLVEPAVVERMADGVAQGFTDVIEQCRAGGGRVGIYPVSDGSWMDMGQLEELEAMRRRLGQN
jgi:dTDP-glucose pyrophosphorylase